MTGGRLRSLVRNLLPHGVVARRRARVAPAPVETAPAVPLRLPDRTLDELLPGPRPESVQLPATELARGDFMASPVHELAVLGLLCRAFQPRRIFEFGTYLGSSTRVMAMNCEARITTLDLDPADRAVLFGEKAAATVLDYASGEAFAGTPEAARIDSVFGDSRHLDYTPWLGAMDLVFVDANHTYPFVKNDTEWAVRLAAPGGVIVWDDYVYSDEHPECAGVAACLNEQAARLSCVHLQGTRLAIGFPHRAS